MQAPVELHSKIVEFFTSIPNIDVSDSRRAFVYSVSLDPQLQDLIDFAGPSAQFLQLLVSTLVKYGNLEDGRDALEAVFEAAKKYVGPDKQEYCDLLIQDWRSFRISYASQQNVSPERPSLTATDKEKAKTNSGTYADDMIQAEELGEEKVSTNKPYAVFLSFNSEDREAVEKIAVHLADHAKLRPWFDQWEQIPGESSMRNLERGLETSSTCAVFVGKSGAGPWQESEVEAALRQQIQSKKFRVIPVLLPDALKEAELPAFLAGNLWVKFQEVLDDKALWLLECGIRGVPPGRGRPKNPKKEQQTAPVSESPNVGQVDVEIAPAEKSVHVFISYRHQEPDNSLAHAFKEVLQKTGHQVFIDTGIRWGADWTKEIREALQKSQFLLLLLSPETAASEMVAEEVAIAKELAQQQNGIPIILPVRVQYPFSEPLPYQLSLWLYTVHQVCWNGVEDTARLVKLLLSTIADRASWPEAVSGQSSPGSVRHITPQPHFDPRDLITPGIELAIDSRFYIMRKADEEVFKEVKRSRAVVTIKGAKQTGKTSLIMRVYAAIRSMQSQLRTAFVDFQIFSHDDLESSNTIWRAIAGRIAKQLQLAEWDTISWKENAGHDQNFSEFLDRVVFQDDETPLLLCFDKVDRMFESSIKSEFFASIRVFHTRGALRDPSWEKVRWVLATSSEPSFFIEDLNKSPFNIGKQVDLKMFTSDEVEMFARRHGLNLDQETTKKILDYVGGHPYLVHLLLYHLIQMSEKTHEQIFDAETAGGGMFRDHLHHYLMQFQREPGIAGAMSKIIKGKGCKDVRMLYRLEAAGLVCWDTKNKIVPLCQLYKEFFRENL